MATGLILAAYVGLTSWYFIENQGDRSLDNWDWLFIALALVSTWTYRIAKRGFG